MNGLVFSTDHACMFPAWPAASVLLDTSGDFIPHHVDVFEGIFLLVDLRKKKYVV